MSSKNSALVEWFIIMRSGRISRRLIPRMSMRKTLSPSVRRLTCSAGVVRASSSMRSDCMARDEHLAAVHHVAVALPQGGGLELGGVGAGVGLGHAEGLQA